MRYLPKYEDDKSQQQQTAYDAANQDPERDGNSSSLQNLQNSLYRSVGDGVLGTLIASLNPFTLCLPKYLNHFDITYLFKFE